MTRAALLEGPIARTLLDLAWPILAVLALQTFVGVAETYFVSFLGTSAIAGVALVFPLFMLMTMMSNGGQGNSARGIEGPWVTPAWRWAPSSPEPEPTLRPGASARRT